MCALLPSLNVTLVVPYFLEGTQGYVFVSFHIEKQFNPQGGFEQNIFISVLARLGDCLVLLMWHFHIKPGV